jgi:surfeit locus 1 family protein
MKIVVKGIEFRFNFISMMFFLTALSILISLGFWQLNRADEKKTFLLKQHLSGAKESIKLSALLDISSDDLRYRKTEMTGEYDEQHQFLIDNQINNGQAGFFVMTPYKIDGLKKAVLVNRGWIPMTKDRQILPNVTISTLIAKVKGRINNFPVVGIRLKGAEIPTQGWPSIVQVVDSQVLSEKLGYSILPFQIELDTEMKDGYSRDWKKQTIMLPEKHLAYAVQWFGLAITLTVLFIWFNRTKLNERTTEKK